MDNESVLQSMVDGGCGGGYHRAIDYSQELEKSKPRKSGCGVFDFFGDGREKLERSNKS